MNAIPHTLDTLRLELRHSARSLSKAPAFAGLAILTLALGIGATSAVFTVLNAVLFKGLPYRDESRIVHVWETDQRTQTRQVSHPDFTDVVNGARSFDGVAGYAFSRMSLMTDGGVEGLSAGRVSWNFFEVLGVQPALGRTFRAEEDQPLRTRDVVMISHGLWQRRFGGDPAIIGRKVTFSDTPLTVIGVLPRDFQFARLGEPEVFTTLSPSQPQVERRFMHWMWAIARVRDGVTAEEANEDLARLGLARAAADTQWHNGTGLRTAPIREAIVGSIGPMSLALFGAVAAVLAIACANVANMLLARALSRRRETSVRIALGASRWRVLVQSLAESLLLSLAGGTLGALWAGPAVRAMIAAIPEGLRQDLPYLRNLTVDPTVLAFTFGVCLVAAVAFGLAAGLRNSDRGLAENLKDGARGSSSRQRLRTALVIGEIAIAVALVSTTALLTRSLVKLLDVDPGFETRGLVLGRVSIPSRQYDTPEKIQPFFESLQARLAALPGVTGVAFVDRPPLMGSGNTGTPSIVGQPPTGAEGPASQLRTVNETYFDVMGLSLVDGRTFTSNDRAGSPRVVLVNRAFVNVMMNGERAVGKSVTFAFAQAPLEIAGVVENERAADLDGRMPPVIYFAWRQDSGSATSVIVRTSSDPRAMVNALRPETLALAPAAEVTLAQTVDDLISSSRATFMRRYPLLVLSWFAVLALVLASIGVYGVMSLSVSERTSEMGIRIAMGAQPENLMALVLRSGARFAAIGTTLGVALTLAAARLMTAYLFETTPYDPVSLCAAALVVIAATCLASAVPAHRASRMDPIAAIRQS